MRMLLRSIPFGLDEGQDVLDVPLIKFLVGRELPILVDPVAILGRLFERLLVLEALLVLGLGLLVRLDPVEQPLLPVGPALLGLGPLERLCCVHEVEERLL